MVSVWGLSRYPFLLVAFGVVWALCVAGVSRKPVHRARLLRGSLHRRWYAFISAQRSFETLGLVGKRVCLPRAGAGFVALEVDR